MSGPALRQSGLSNTRSITVKNHAQDDRREADLFQEVETLLNENRPEEALERIKAAGVRSKAMRNAYGVCLMRAGRIDKANAVFRELVLPGTGFFLDPEAPTVFKTNYATVLLLGTHVNGCVEVLSQIEDQNHPSVIRIRSAIAAWKRTLGPVRRWLSPLLGLPEKVVPLTFAPGDLWFKGPGGRDRRAA
jgi:hypothetical protein